MVWYLHAVLDNFCKTVLNLAASTLFGINDIKLAD